MQPARAVEGYLSQFLDERPLPTNLRGAIRYALLGAGKRLRPILVIRSCEAVGGASECAMAPAAAIEMIHCFSLVHDDLPAMDDDDLRRGRATLHRHTNEAMAILAGDAMMGLAFELLAMRLEPSDLARRLGLELATGTNEMIAGQVYDTLSDVSLPSDPLSRLKRVHEHKTGALIRCCCRMGAMCGEAGEGELQALTLYGETIGLMFQVVDDLLDVTQTTKNLGKTANKDVDQGKLTYPSVLGIEGTRLEVKRLQAQAHGALEALGGRADRLRELCDFMAVRES
jgi:geranylgeranyl diphosphate synthase type II